MTFLLDPATPERHSLFEDAFALLVGTALMALAVQILQASGLITGQIAGLSLLTSYATGYSFGAVFFVLNLPFYALAFLRMGARFTAKTFCAVALLTLFTELLPTTLHFESIQPLTGALLAGVVSGAGLLVLFRHGASLGGVGIAALFLQDRVGIKAGWVQLGFDACVFLLAFWLFPAPTVLYSLIGAFVVNLVIAMNHRRDRYIAS
ncbi:YitT family protein [Pseudoruegeria sp. SHC-113]|uniref:YitT family protein n=1 Tax=Pseudoruegeria sp. SHC-113 TaxID=2855439 RepID=UPI0021BA7819|nr:YitT family protein [Pseudoruegeria sp. SHC-113]MCT8160533.1 YitT family protein [Pseudoruegeria sp. SHC-113]